MQKIQTVLDFIKNKSTCTLLFYIKYKGKATT